MRIALVHFTLIETPDYVESIKHLSTSVLEELEQVKSILKDNPDNPRVKRMRKPLDKYHYVHLGNSAWRLQLEIQFNSHKIRLIIVDPRPKFLSKR